MHYINNFFHLFLPSKIIFVVFSGLNAIHMLPFFTFSWNPKVSLFIIIPTLYLCISSMVIAVRGQISLLFTSILIWHQSIFSVSHIEFFLSIAELVFKAPVSLNKLISPDTLLVQNGAYL